MYQWLGKLKGGENSNQSIQQQKQISRHMEQLEQRIRRSSKLKDGSTFRELLAYAYMVRDEEEVYSYMEENKIGLEEPEFWAAKLNMLKNRCQYRDFVSVLKAISKRHQLKQHPKYWLINDVVSELEQYLQKLLRKKAKGKRSAKQYEVLNLGDVEKQTRKFGKIQVYVDPDCRKQYRLEDLTQFVCSRLGEQCEIEKNCYEREISAKPLSFIGKDKDKINKISWQIFGHRNQKEGMGSDAPKIASRISLASRRSNKGCLQLVQTPNFKKKSLGKQSQKRKLQYPKQIDSFEIFKNCSRSNAHSRKEQKQDENPEFEINTSISSVKKQKLRQSPNKDASSIFSEIDTEVKQSFTFSFANERKHSSQQQRQQSRNSHRHVKSRSEKHKMKSRASQNFKDFAFVEETSHSQTNFYKENSKNTLDLENVIKQIQMQKYDSQTFSEVDSNKENNFLLGQEVLSINFGIESIHDIEALVKERKKLETIKKGEEVSHRQKQKQKLKYESQKQNEVMNESSQAIYQQLLSCLQGDGGSSTEEIDHQLLSLSQRNKKKRISRISEEKSYSFSQARARSRSNT